MFTLDREAKYKETIKKSRFYVRAAPVGSAEDAAAFLERIRDGRATHHCWAYRIGPQYRFSDDGEPGGTAGKPILRAIEHQDIDGVMVVVIRYYGGIKLGAGGLTRAYGGCAARCLQEAARRPIVRTVEVGLKIGFNDLGALYAAMTPFNAEKCGERYTPNGLELRLRIDRAKRQAMLEALTDATAGRLDIIDDDC